MKSPRYPFTGFPSGWYAVARSDELPAGTVHGVRYFDEDIALYRATDGTAHATGAHCPHLGAYLPAGGRVVDDRIRCPFHGFEFDGRGRCTKTACGTKVPPKARLRSWHVREIAGFVLLWYDATGRAPAWEIEVPDMTGWTSPRIDTVEMRTHPQETSENSVDLGHFSELHGFRRPTILEPCQTDGPLLTISYAARLDRIPRVVDRVRRMFGAPEAGLSLHFKVRVHGLGWSLAEGEIAALGMRFRQFVLATPIDQDRIHLRIGTAVERRLPGVDWVLREFGFRSVAKEVERDRPIWENKRYLEHPVLAKGDGPIGAYRRWARQFYPQRSPACRC